MRMIDDYVFDGWLAMAGGKQDGTIAAADVQNRFHWEAVAGWEQERAW